MGKIQINKASIISLKTDALVNAANEALQQSSGVCGAIFRAAGEPELRAACEEIGGCKTGSAVLTPGFNLKQKYIIHAVGPRWVDGNQGEPRLLRAAYTQSLKLAVENGCKSIGFPLISAGYSGCPIERAWHEAIWACRDFRCANPKVDIDIQFAVIDGKVLEIGKKILDEFNKEKTSAYLKELDDDSLKTIKQKILDGIGLLIDKKVHPIAGGLLDVLCEPEVLDGLTTDQMIHIAEALFPGYVQEEAWIEKYCDILLRIVDEAKKKNTDGRAALYENHMRDVLIPALKKGVHTGDIWDDLEPLEDIYKVTACLLEYHTNKDKEFAFEVSENSLMNLARSIQNSKGGGGSFLGIVSIPLKTEDRQYAVFLSWILEELLSKQEGLKAREE